MIQVIEIRRLANKMKPLLGNRHVSTKPCELSENPTLWGLFGADLAIFTAPEGGFVDTNGVMQGFQNNDAKCQHVALACLAGNAKQNEAVSTKPP